MSFLGGALRIFTVRLCLACLVFSLPVAARAENASPKPALQAGLDALAARARPGTLGIEVLDLATSERWGVNADRPLPMMSVFKVPIAAAVLARVDSGEVPLDRQIKVTRKDLRNASRIARTFKGESMSFTVGQLLKAAVSRSDNTAADRLIAFLGGPGEVTRFLRDRGIAGMSVDLDEGGIGRIFSALGASSVPPRNETPAARDARLRKGLEDFLADPRNRSTPAAAAELLRKLWEGRLLSPASTRHLLRLMHGQTVPVRLSGGLPPEVRLAHKSGLSLTRNGITGAINDIGILSWPNGHAVIVAAFLSGSNASREEQTRLFADLARMVAARLAPARR